MSQKKKMMIFWIGLGCVLVLCVLALLMMQNRGAKVVVTQNGKVYGTYSLSENQTITIVNENGINIIEIKDSEVDMIEADCPNQTCVMSPPMSADMTFPIVCLPHELIVEIQE